MNCYKKLVIIGGKAGAILCYDLIADYVEQIFFLECFFKKDDLKSRSNVVFLDGKIIDHLDKIENYFVATGDNQMRQKITDDVIIATGKFPLNLYHEKSYVSKTASLGYGNLVLSGAVVHTNSHIGNGCIVNTNAIVEHDNFLGNYTQVSPGAVLCGYVKIGDFCSISANATVIPHISVANNTVVGAGAVVTSNIDEEFCLFAGVPAKLKKRYL